MPRFVAPIVLEGGAVHVDGEGTCLVCAGTVLDPGRNPGLGRAEAEAALADHLGVAKVIWLEQGLVGDRAGGHVDNLACFARPGVVLALACRDPEDPNHAVLQDNLTRLRAESDAQGRTLEVIEIEQPPAQFRADGSRIPASYINFYLANGAVLMPMFDTATDNPAYRAIAAAFPDRRIVQIDASRPGPWRRRHPRDHPAAAARCRCPSRADEERRPTTRLRPSARPSMPPAESKNEKGGSP